MRAFNRPLGRGVVTSDILLRELFALEEYLGDLRRHTLALDAVSGTGPLATVIQETAGMRAALGKLGQTLESIRERVLAFDGEQLGSPMESIGELLIRAARLVITTQLAHVAETTHSRDAQVPTTATGMQVLFAGKFRCIDDIVSFARAELDRINDIWMRYRTGPRAAPTTGRSVADDERRAQYRRAIREAQQAVVAIGADPDFAHFLDKGSAGLGSREARVACLQISRVLRMTLDGRPESLCPSALEPGAQW